MSDRLKPHRDYLEANWQEAQAAPLSLRKAGLVAGLIDDYVDRAFRVQSHKDDILAWRESHAAKSPALGLVMALSARRNEVTPTLEAVPVPLADYGKLAVEDFMVSLYNDHSVQRLRLALPDGSRRDMQDTLREAIAALDRL